MASETRGVGRVYFAKQLGEEGPVTFAYTELGGIASEPTDKKKKEKCLEAVERRAWRWMTCENEDTFVILFLG